MGNEYTKMQIRTFLEKAIESRSNPNPREKIRRERVKRSQKVAKKYGF